LEARIAITGLGIVSPCGTGVEPLASAVREGRSAIEVMTRFRGTTHLSRVGGQVSDFDPTLGIRKDQSRYIKKNIKVMALDIQLAVAAVNQAILDSGLPIGDFGANEPVLPTIDHTRLGMVFGTNFIPTDLEDLAHPVQVSQEQGRFTLHAFGTRGIPQMFPLWLLKYLPNMHACHSSVLWDAQGPSNSLTCGDAGGLLAIDECTRIINRGTADMMLGGGAESRVRTFAFLRQDLLRRLTKGDGDPARVCRPFDVGRTGPVAAEGAAVAMLERWTSALARGARIYGEVLGTGAAAFTAGVSTCDPDGRAVAIAVRSALGDAGVGPEDLGAVYAHGTALDFQDQSEARGLEAALGDAAASVPVTATKGVTGNMGASSGVADLAVALVLGKQGLIPPILNCDRPDPEVRLNLVRGEARPLRKDLILVTTNAVGGQVAAAVIRVNR